MQIGRLAVRPMLTTAVFLEKHGRGIVLEWRCAKGRVGSAVRLLRDSYRHGLCICLLSDVTTGDVSLERVLSRGDRVWSRTGEARAGGRHGSLPWRMLRDMALLLGMSILSEIRLGIRRALGKGDEVLELLLRVLWRLREVETTVCLWHGKLTGLAVYGIASRRTVGSLGGKHGGFVLEGRRVPLYCGARLHVDRRRALELGTVVGRRGRLVVIRVDGRG